MTHVLRFLTGDISNIEQLSDKPKIECYSALNECCLSADRRSGGEKEATRADRGLIPRVRSRFGSSVYGSANCCRTTRFGSIIARWFQTLPARRTRLASRNQSRFARRPARLVATQVRRQKKKRLLHTGVQFPEQTAASVRASMLAPIACGLLDCAHFSTFS